MRSESQLLASTLNSARQLTSFYLGHTKTLDVSKRFQAGTYTTNSIHWLVAHLAWAEDFLILRGVGNKSTGLAWLTQFRIGTEHPQDADMPSYEEATRAFHEIHQLTMNLLQELPDEVLNEKNHVGLKFGPADSKRSIIHHSIRHEGMHCGHIGWAIRMQGGKVL